MSHIFRTKHSLAPLQCIPHRLSGHAKQRRNFSITEPGCDTLQGMSFSIGKLRPIFVCAADTLAFRERVQPGEASRQTCERLILSIRIGPTLV